MNQPQHTEKTKQIALIAGATGLTGSHLLNLILNDPFWDHVIVLARKENELKHEKLQWIHTDLFRPELWEQYFNQVTCVFCCTGTTKAKTPDSKTYEAIDYGIPVSLARAATQFLVPNMIVISAIGASEKSTFTYLKLKGKMEKDIETYGPETVCFLRPSLITGNRKESRIMEKMAAFLVKKLSFLFPINYRMTTGMQLADFMNRLGKSSLTKGSHVYHLRDMKNKI